MSIKQYPGGIITQNPTAPTASSASGIWTANQAENYTKQGIWPRSPGAPTIGTATDAATGGGVSVTFSAPSCTGSNAITGYTATSTPGSVTGTAASSPVIVSGLTNGTAYTFKVKATNGAGTGPESAASNSATPTAPVTGQQAYTTAGSYSWVAPTGVTKVSVVAVGGGGGGSYPGPGGGGGLGYKNNYTVNPGCSYTVVVGAAGIGCSVSPTSGGNSYFVNVCTVKGGKGNCYGGGTPTQYATGGTYTGDGGGNGGNNAVQARGGGGAGGYSGNGGSANSAYGSAIAGLPGAACSGAGGSGGSAAATYPYCSPFVGGGGGGGVGILGKGATGAAGASGGYGGGGGSGGSNGTGSASICGNSAGGAYGGGGGAGYRLLGCSYSGGNGAVGAVRIIWPGNTRSFPSTNTGNL